MKYLFFLPLVVWSSIQAYSQSARIYYLKNGSETQDKTKAHYYRDINKIDSKTYFSTQYSVEGIKQSEGYLESLDPYVLHGENKTYYPNNQVAQEGKYEHGRIIGEWVRYYSNGQLKEKGKYVTTPLKQEGTYVNQQRFVLEAYKDSTGKTLVENGMGEYKSYYPDGKLYMTGAYEKGEKTGLWTGYFPNQEKYFEESYKKGMLQSGISYDSLGNTYKYSQVEQIGEFLGGTNQMYYFLSKNIRYPKEALASKTEGRVFLAFDIEKDGSVSNITILKSPDQLLTREAVRVLLLMNDHWVPGRLRGQPVKTRYNLPMAFKL